MANNADGQIIINLKLDQTEFDNGINGIGNKTGTITSKIKSFFTGATSSVETFGQRVQATFAGMVLTNVVTSAWSTITGSIEKATNRLDAMAKAEKVIGLITGDTEAAKNVVNELTDAVTNTAYGLDTASTSVQKLTSSGMNVQQATQMVETMMDAIAVYGDGTNATLENVDDALAKIVSSGKVTADQWQRLTDAGIPVLKLLSEQLGMTQAEVTAALSNGTISAEQFATALQTALSQGTASLASVTGQAKEMSGSFAASFDNMKARVAIGVASIITAFNTWAADNSLPNIQSMIANSGTAIKLMLQGIAGAVPELLSNFQALVPIIQTAYSAFEQLASGSITVEQFFSVLAGLAPQVATALGEMAIQALNAGTEFINNLATGITQNAPAIVAQATDIVQGFLSGLNVAIPSLVTAGMNLILSVAQGFVQGFPQLTNEAVYLIADIASVFVNSLGPMVEVGAEIVLTLIEGVGNALPGLAREAAEIMTTIGEGIGQKIPEIAAKAPQVIQDFANQLAIAVPTLISGGFDMLSNIVQGIIQALPDLIATVPQIITTFANIINQNMPIILAKGVELLWELIKGIISCIPNLIAAVPQIVEAIVSVISAYNWLSLGKNIITFFKDGITSMIGSVKSGVSNLSDNIVSIIKELPSTMLNLGKNIVTGLLNGIKNSWGTITSWLKEGALGLIGTFTSALGIHSPSTKFRDKVGRFLMPGVVEGVKESLPKALSQMRSLAGVLLDTFNMTSLSDKFAIEGAYNIAGGAGSGSGYGSSYVVNQTINSAKELRPSEIAQETKNTIRRIEWE